MSSVNSSRRVSRSPLSKASYPRFSRSTLGCATISSFRSAASLFSRVSPPVKMAASADLLPRVGFEQRRDVPAQIRVVRIERVQLSAAQELQSEHVAAEGPPHRGRRDDVLLRSGGREEHL